MRCNLKWPECIAGGCWPKLSMTSSRHETYNSWTRTIPGWVWNNCSNLTTVLNWKIVWLTLTRNFPFNWKQWTDLLRRDLSNLHRNEMPVLQMRRRMRQESWSIPIYLQPGVSIARNQKQRWSEVNWKSRPKCSAVCDSCSVDKVAQANNDHNKHPNLRPNNGPTVWEFGPKSHKSGPRTDFGFFCSEDGFATLPNETFCSDDFYQEGNSVGIVNIVTTLSNIREIERVLNYFGLAPLQYPKPFKR